MKKIINGLLKKKFNFLFINTKNIKNNDEKLTIKSGINGPNIKNGTIDDIINLIKTVFKYFILLIKSFKL